MPNWCQNIATIKNEDIDKIDAIENELSKEKPELFNSIQPRPVENEEGWYDWNVSNWGTKWDASVYSFERIADNAILINFDTAWGPPIGFYDYLTSNDYDVTAFYNEEGMAFCGSYEDGFNDDYQYAEMSADEMEFQLPEWAETEFNLISRQRDNEAEDEELEDSEEMPEYEMTDWFNFKIKPVHKGWYEVRTVAWPFPHRAEWSGKKWLIDGEITDWRGMTQAQHDLYVALEELKDEFDKMMENE